jgi:hypothetical protein
MNWIVSPDCTPAAVTAELNTTVVAPIDATVVPLVI